MVTLLSYRSRFLQMFASIRWIILALALLISSTSGHAGSFATSLQNMTLELGQSTILSLQFQELQVPSPPQLPSLQDATVRYIGPVSQQSFVNGKRSSSITHRYQLTPKKQGELIIPALSITLGGQAYSSQPLTLTVAPPNSMTAPEGEAGLLFLKLITPTNEIVLGETFPFEIRLFFAANLRETANPKLELDGFILGKTAQPEQGQTLIGGKRYGTVTWRMSATAAKAGSLPFGPVEMEMVAVFPGAQPRAGLFDPFGMVADQRRVSLHSGTNVLRVVSPPVNGRPADFAGAVGKFRLLASISPTNIAAGDPITLRAQITGRGNFDQINMPVVASTNGLRIYDSQSEVQTTDDLGLEGVKSFEQVVIPEHAGLEEFPEIQFSYFDPGLKSYVTLRHAPTPITVRPGASLSVSTTLPGSNGVVASPAPPPTPVPTKDELQHIVYTLGRPLNQRPWIRRPAVLAALSFPLPAYALFAAWHRRREEQIRDPRRQRRATAVQTIATELSSLTRHAAAGDSVGFFGSLGVILREHIGLTLDIPSAAITEEIVDSRLISIGLADDAITGLHELFSALNQARFAPGHSVEELESYQQRLHRVCEALDGTRGHR
ncbi:MAG: protein BatD [Pedosphaera sp.]|nr:protein BatD [Pedosphaera sp.]